MPCCYLLGLLGHLSKSVVVNKSAVLGSSGGSSSSTRYSDSITGTTYMQCVFRFLLLHTSSKYKQYLPTVGTSAGTHVAYVITRGA